MKLAWKLREKLVVMILVLSILPLMIAIIYVGSRAKIFLEEQALEYMQAKADGFALMVQARSDAISGNIDVIKEQLAKQLKDDIVRLAAREKYFKSGYMLIIQSNGVCLYHPMPEYNGNMTLYNKYDFIRDAVGKAKNGQHTYIYTFNGEKKIGGLAYNKDLDIVMWVAAPAKEAFAKISMLNAKMYVFLAIVAVIVIVTGGIISQRLARKVKQISNNMEDIAEGEGDLTVRLPVITSDELGELAHWFNSFMENLEDVIIKVKQAANQVDAATQEVAAGAQGLSQTSQEQASAVEEVAATIEEMTSAIKQNASNAEAAREKAKGMVNTAKKTSEAAQELIKAMNEMSVASKKIGDITVTVNEVAFQTNLLALNAAVEAARAGEHGKGFAVVAEEVRALAQRSADAVRQIKILIEDTVNKISAGDEMVKRSGESITEIIVHIDELSQTMEDIAASSAEQSSGVDELNRAIAQIDSTTQQNASTVEQLSGTADNLSTEARDLTVTVERFRVSGEAAKKAKRTLVKKPETPAKPVRPAPGRPAPPRPMPARSADSIADEDFEEF